MNQVQTNIVRSITSKRNSPCFIKTNLRKGITNYEEFLEVKAQDKYSKHFHCLVISNNGSRDDNMSHMVVLFADDPTMSSFQRRRSRLFMFLNIPT